MCLKTEMSFHNGVLGVNMEPFIFELNINRVSAQEHHILMITLCKHVIIQFILAVCNIKIEISLSNHHHVGIKHGMI